MFLQMITILQKQTLPQLTAISRLLISYSEIFSNFDPNVFAEGTLSDDFITQLKRISENKRGAKMSSRLLLPATKRNEPAGWFMRWVGLDHIVYASKHTAKELAGNKLGTKLIVILGHPNYGAVDAAIHMYSEGSMSAINNKIEKAMGDCNYNRNAGNAELAMFTKIIKAHIENSLQQIITDSTYLFNNIETRKTGIVPA
jgi:Carbonic anhydrase